MKRYTMAFFVKHHCKFSFFFLLLLCCGKSLPSCWGGVTTGILRNTFDRVMIPVLSVLGWTFVVYIAEYKPHLLGLCSGQGFCLFFDWSSNNVTFGLVPEVCSCLCFAEQKVLDLWGSFWGTVFLCYAYDSMTVVFFCWNLFALSIDKNNFSLSTSTCRLC